MLRDVMELIGFLIELLGVGYGTSLALVLAEEALKKIASNVSRLIHH